MTLSGAESSMQSMTRPSEMKKGVAGVNRATPCLASGVFLTVGAYIFQRKPTETERPIWSVPKLLTCALPASPK